MNDPATAEVWMAVFGRDFGGMSQGDNKMGQKGTSAMFVMLPSNVPNIPKDRVITYARVVVDHRPQKADPNRIQITAGGNLINYPGELTTRMANITMAKILWNSVLSTPRAKYMTLDIKNFYLSTVLNQFKYMCIPFALFPPWIVKQYALKDKVLNRHIYLEMQRATWGFPRPASWPTSSSKNALPPTDILNASKRPAYGSMRHAPSPSHLLLTISA
jgi:hypothetical protein